MSQFRGGPRYSDDTLAYREAPPRWDAERFAREREVRYNGPVPERERPYEGYGRRMEVRLEDRYATPPRREEPRFEEKIFAEERYGPPARRVDRQYYEEDEIYSSRPPAAGAVVPFRRPEAPPPPRPGIIRRQSSLDTFDRRGPRRYDDFGPPPPPRLPEPIPPQAPAYADPRYHEREYDDREYRIKEREWVTRKRDDSGSRDGFEREEFREEVIEEVGEREKPYPRRGKTRMPRRLVSIQVLYDLRYPFHEEGDIIVIEKALGKENIDEVVGLSKSFRERETTTVHLIEAPPPPPEIREEIIEKVETVNIKDAPRSVREWDLLSVRSPSPARTARSHRSRSRKPSHSRRGSSPERVEKIIDVHTEVVKVRDLSPSRTVKSHHSHHAHRSRSRKPSHSRRGSSPVKAEKIIDVHSDVVTVREVSPSRTAKSHRSHKSRKSRHSRSSSSSSSSSSSDSRTQIIERREVLEIDQDESNSVHVGPLALVVSPHRERRKSRSDRDIHAQIRELEEERRKLERERKERDVIKVRRGTIVREVDEEDVEIKKKKAPSARVMRGMLATLT